VTDYLAFPPAKEVRGTVAAPPSKSATNRALVLAALSETAVEIADPLESEDTRALERCLAAMGARFEASPRVLSVHGPLAGAGGREIKLDAGESGTAARFLAAVASATPGRFLLTGSARLRERPIEELVFALRSAGAAIADAGEPGHLPLAISGGSLRSTTVSVDASRSSQFFSALLLVAPAVEGGLTIVPIAGVASAPYVETTLECLRAFGHEVTGGLAAAQGIRVRRGAAAVRRYEVPGDYSSALPLLAAAGAAGGRVTVTGLAASSGDADARALPALERMGVELERGAGSITARALRGGLSPATVVATDFPDAVPALAALAALAPGQSRFEGIAHLRWKESDRIAALAALLTAAGAGATALEDSLVVEGSALPRSGGAVRLPTFGDHRIAMAGGLLSLALPGLLIENPDCVSKSYPGFYRALATIRY
jgi:3-phosphoshikimate 1-carboxyvinyltransferase